MVGNVNYFLLVSGLVLVLVVMVIEGARNKKGPGNRFICTYSVGLAFSISVVRLKMFTPFHLVIDSILLLTEIILRF